MALVLSVKINYNIIDLNMIMTLNFFTRFSQRFLCLHTMSCSIIATYMEILN
jgi:hypothetical protein